MAPLVRTGGSRHTGLAAPPHRNIHKWKENYQQGMEQAQEKVVREMLADHMPMELIMKYSELSEERILELKKDLEQAGEL